MNDIDEYFNSIGEKGNTERLHAIARSNLGERSDAAYLALEKRNRRKEWMDKGLSFEDARLLVDREYCNKNSI